MTRQNFTWGHLLWIRSCVMHAVILRDIRSRFFDHGLGFLVVPLFPVVHLLILLLVYSLLGRGSPFGEDTKLFFATGLLPTLIFMYVSRFMSESILKNKSMMAFPVVQFLDIVFARALLELVAGILSALLIFIFLFSIGTDPQPHDPNLALQAFAVISLLSIGMGIIVSVIAAIIPAFMIVYALSLIVVYLLSGSLFVVSYLPADIAWALSWNPVLHAVEWMRTAYYIGYPDQTLNKTYLVGWAFSTIAMGLMMERIFRSRMLIG